MTNSWFVLVPAALVLLWAVVRKNINQALMIGLASAALIATHGSLAQGLTLLSTRLYDQITDTSNLFLYFFLICISILIVLIGQTGGAFAFARVAAQRIKNARQAEFYTLLFSAALFLDDYLNNLTVGSIMRPITDRLAIPRAKLAFFIHAMAAPFIILIPISSWVAMITSQLDQANISPTITGTTTIIADPFYLYLQTIPFIFYSIISIVSLLYIVQSRISYGPMRAHELIAQKTGNVLGGKEAPATHLESNAAESGSLVDLFVPLGTIVASLIGGMLYSGNYWLFGGSNTFLEAFKNNPHSALVLCIAGLTSLAVGFGLALTRRKINVGTVPSIIAAGTQLMFSTVLMIFFASTLGKMLEQDLMTGAYIAHNLLYNAAAWMLPCMIFGITLMVATILGSSWGAIMLMIPIALPILLTITHTIIPIEPSALPLIFPLIGAIFSGAVCGEQISPISNSTIMAAASSGSYPIDHVKTQFPYALPAVVGAIVAYLVAGLVITQSMTIVLAASLASGTFVSIGLLTVCNRIFGK